MVNIVPKVFPDKPESDDDYTEILTVYESGTFVVPEDGWFKIVVTGRGNKGTNASRPPVGKPEYGIVSMSARGGDGGQAGGAAISIFQFNKGEEIPYTISGNSAIFKDMRGTGTTASGGNIANYTGNKGSSGEFDGVSARVNSYDDTVMEAMDHLLLIPEEEMEQMFMEQTGIKKMKALDEFTKQVDLIQSLTSLSFSVVTQTFLLIKLMPRISLDLCWK